MIVMATFVFIYFSWLSETVFLMISCSDTQTDSQENVCLKIVFLLVH